MGKASSVLNIVGLICLVVKGSGWQLDIQVWNSGECFEPEIYIPTWGCKYGV